MIVRCRSYTLLCWLCWAECGCTMFTNIWVTWKVHVLFAVWHCYFLACITCNECIDVSYSFRPLYVLCSMVGRSVGCSVGHSVSGLVGQSVGRLVYCMCWSLLWALQKWLNWLWCRLDWRLRPNVPCIRCDACECQLANAIERSELSDDTGCRDHHCCHLINIVSCRY